MISQKGHIATIDTVNLYLLDAIDKIKAKKDEGENIMQHVSSIYMISPILMIRKELNFLKELGFDTKTYNKNQLADDHSVKDNPEAALAISIFGQGQSIGRAILPFEHIYSKDWKDKKEKLIQEFARKGIAIRKEKSSNETSFENRLHEMIEPSLPCDNMDNDAKPQSKKRVQEL